MMARALAAAHQERHLGNPGHRAARLDGAMLSVNAV
jgi:hypothetical protein